MIGTVKNVKRVKTCTTTAACRSLKLIWRRRSPLKLIKIKGASANFVCNKNRMYRYLNVREIFVSKGVVSDRRALQMGPRAKPEDHCSPRIDVYCFRDLVSELRFCLSLTRFCLSSIVNQVATMAPSPRPKGGVSADNPLVFLHAAIGELLLHRFG